MSCRASASTRPYLRLNRVVRRALRAHLKPKPECLPVALVWRETLHTSGYPVLRRPPKDLHHFPKELTRIKSALLALFL
ncbi:hypothetical protein SBA2_670095 [Acidobacteriia bacterium SbA2]|nr:hypothetical protein SBA2_670095 [Acidobacteriia bacterium SbA2]